LGAGDGTLALTLANRLCDRWPDVELTLVDRQTVVANETLRDFQSLGWKPKLAAADVFDWLAATREPADVMVTNLFLHHFEAADLRRLLLAVAAGCRCFVALEPRRSAVALLGAQSLGLIGCNRVTRHDARVSVHAGFRGQELSQLWPAGSTWTLCEQPAGLFSHLFVATRIAR